MQFGSIGLELGSRSDIVPGWSHIFILLSVVIVTLPFNTQKYQKALRASVQLHLLHCSVKFSLEIHKPHPYGEVTTSKTINHDTRLIAIESPTYPGFQICRKKQSK